MNTLWAERYTAPPVAAYTSSQEAIDDVYLERQLELSLEGHRFFDLRRAQLPITRIPEDVDGATGIVTVFLPVDDRDMNALPTLQSEIYANENMVQTQGIN